MTESETKFEKFLAEMKELIMNTAPALKNSIIMLENQERNEGTSYYEEIQEKEIELDTLRKTYKKIMNDLIELDKEKAKSIIKEIIKIKRNLDANYIRDLQEANGGSWVDKFFLSLPI